MQLRNRRLIRELTRPELMHPGGDEEEVNSTVAASRLLVKNLVLAERWALPSPPLC
jgi:hypothetical protein